MHFFPVLCIKCGLFIVLLTTLSVVKIGECMSVEHWWSNTHKEKPKYAGKNPVSFPLCAPQIPGLACD